MLTTCCICGDALSVPGPDDDGAWCRDCLVRNFGGQTVPDVEVLAFQAVGLGRRRAAYARMVLGQLGEDVRHAG